MVTAAFSIHNLEFFLLILVRVSALISVAPFFNTKGVPGKTKIGLAFFLCFLVAILLVSLILIAIQFARKKLREREENRLLMS